MAQIDDFKANLLGGGARTNQFRVTITPPVGISIGLDVRRTSFLCSATSLPQTELGTVELKYRGRTINIAGDRVAANTWSTTLTYNQMLIQQLKHLNVHGSINTLKHLE